MDKPTIAAKNKKGTSTMAILAELRAAEKEVEREWQWQWLHDALNAVAHARAKNGDAQAFRLMQAQAMAVSQRRIELSMKIASRARRVVHRSPKEMSGARGTHRPIEIRRGGKVSGGGRTGGRFVARTTYETLRSVPYGSPCG
jgi:hypothetical protein